MIHKLLIFLFIFIPVFAFPQTEEYDKNGKKMSVNDYLKASEEKKADGDYKEASRFMNGAATWHWERKEYDKAVEYFLMSIKLNEIINNEQGIIGIKNNLGMIYADLKQYEKAYTNFSLVLEERKKVKEPVSIIASLVNIAVITNNLKQFDKSISYLNEALELALRMGDAEQMRSCYGMLAETYEKKGDVEQMLKYFNLYKTFHEQTQRKKIGKLEVSVHEAELRAKLLEMENRMKENTLVQKNTIIQEQNKELEGLNSAQRELLQTMTKRDMLLKITQNELKYSELHLKQQKTQEELKDVKQNFLRNILIIAFIFAILMALFLLQKYSEKKKINEKLHENQVKLSEQSQILQHQAEELMAQSDEIQATNHSLTETNSVKDKVLSIVSHDVRSPLSMIVGFLDLFESGDLDADEVKTLSFQLKNSTTNTLTMLDNLLTWAKAQMKGIIVKPTNIDLVKLVDNKIELLTEVANSKNISLINALTSEQKAYADLNHVEIIIQNLLNNAIKFTPQNGFITVDAIVKDKFTEIRVSDTGVGMSEQNLQKLFSIENHFTTTGTAHEKGTGLGLLLCKEFIEKNGGTISVKSKVGEGTTFSVTLPNCE